MSESALGIPPEEQGQPKAPENSSPQNPTSANYIVVFHGRGVLNTCIVKGLRDNVAERAQALVDQGFEVHIYGLKLATRGLDSLLPAGFAYLELEWHLYDATSEFDDLVTSVEIKLDEHTLGAARKYINRTISKLEFLRDGLPTTQEQEPRQQQATAP